MLDFILGLFRETKNLLLKSLLVPIVKSRNFVKKWYNPHSVNEMLDRQR